MNPPEPGSGRDIHLTQPTGKQPNFKGINYSVFVLLLSIPIRKMRASTCRGDQRYQHLHCTQQKQRYDHKRLDFPNIYQLSANPSDMFEKCSNF